jgi:hypothetical protein
MMIISKEASEPSGRFPATIGGLESVIAELRIATATLATGVRNPTRRQAPQPDSTRHAKITANVRLLPWTKYKMPSVAAVGPTTARINSRAAPGLPPGNVENSLCSVPLPTVPVYG